MLGIIRRNFKYLNNDAFLTLYKTLVRSHLEYANSVWNPHSEKLIKDLERVQMRATEIIGHIKSMSYIEHLTHLNLPTLKYRRLRGDMIETYKIINEKYDKNALLNI